MVRIRKRYWRTIVERKGSAPRSIGTKMLIMEDGRCVDTIGGGCIEAAIVSKALLILRGCAKAPQIVHVDMTGEDAEEEGMVCGGKVKDIVGGSLKIYEGSVWKNNRLYENFHYGSV